jgi:hypothetical protein
MGTCPRGRMRLIPHGACVACGASGAHAESKNLECAAVRATFGTRAEAARVHLECGGLMAIQRTSALAMMYYPDY